MKTALQLAAKVKAATGNDIDPKFFNQVAQFAHFGMMFTVTTVIILIASKLGRAAWGYLGGFAVCAVYAIVHEFYFDPRYENAATRGSDLEDFIYLIFGSIFAELLFRFLFF